MKDFKKEYRAKQADIANLLEMIAGEMKNHQNHAETSELNWGYVGDLGYAKSKLVEILCHFTQQTDDDENTAIDRIETELAKCHN